VSANAIEPLSILAIGGIFFYHVQIAGREILEIIFVVLLLRRAISYFMLVQLNYNKLLKNSGSIRVFRKFRDELAEHREDLNSDGVAPDLDQPIRLQDVSFNFGSDPEVLKKINLTIPPKRTVAFVGDSGVGKSTLATLLTGMLKPSSGEIFLGDRSYGEIDLGWLRRQSGFVTQETVIFNDTIWNNITLWRANSAKEKVREAATGAHIEEFISTLPDGYNTVLGDNGINISGGQRQRISIARELFKDVKLLIFDEATSSLDGHSEKEIQRNIDEFRGERTIVLIAHRLSTIKQSDLIVVLKNGEIVEQGSFDELYDLKGEFRSMVNQQQGLRDKGQEVSHKL
jgi:subfamily B ATP-binding cassette protein MsbA